MQEVDVKLLDVPQLLTYARSLGVDPRGMNREAIEEEIAVTTKPVIPSQEDGRIKTLESIIAAISPVLEQLQVDVKQLQVATGLRAPDKEEKDA